MARHLGALIDHLADLDWLEALPLAEDLIVDEPPREENDDFIVDEFDHGDDLSCPAMFDRV